MPVRKAYVRKTKTKNVYVKAGTKPTKAKRPPRPRKK